jgi:acetyl esterase/lipase
MEHSMSVSASNDRTFKGLMRTLAATCLYLFGLLACAMTNEAKAQEHHHHHEESAVPADARNCYDPNDSTEIRLWNNRAPGAVGDDPCRDIPYLKIYPAAPGTSATRTAIIVIPGGGYDRLTDRKEQAPVGAYFSNQLHITTFVLFYRLVQKNGDYRYPIPMWDGQRALKLVRARAAQYGVEPNRIGLFGFSAGGHLASTITLHAGTDFDLSKHDPIDAESARPDFLGLGYPVISMLPMQFASTNSLGHLLYGYDDHELDHLEHYLSGQLNVTPRTPPVFLFESMDDKQISAENSALFSEALRTAQIPADVHLFVHGVHGAGLAVGIPEEEAWPGMFADWLGRLGYLR